MTEQTTTDAAPTRGPVQPTQPDVSAIGGGRAARRARLAAASAGKQGGAPTGTPAAPASVAPAKTSDDSRPNDPSEAGNVPQQQQHAEPATPAPAAAATEAPVTTPQQVEQAAATPPATLNPPAADSQVGKPSTPPVAHAEPKPGDSVEQPVQPVASKATKTVEDGKADEVPTATDQRKQAPAVVDPPEVPETVVATVAPDQDRPEVEPQATVEGTQLAGQNTQVSTIAEDAEDEFDEDQEDDEDEDQGEAEFSGGKVTNQTYVPDAVAAKFQQMQTTGRRTAELIVLTAVRNCADRLPQLVEEARGPVHKEGLFAGLEVLENKPGRKAKPKPNSSRVQYQVSPKFLPDLKKVAKKHKLKLSVLVRLALGDFFNIPVRMGRTKR